MKKILAVLLLSFCCYAQTWNTTKDKQYHPSTDGQGNLVVSFEEDGLPESGLSLVYKLSGTATAGYKCLADGTTQVVVQDISGTTGAVTNGQFIAKGSFKASPPAATLLCSGTVQFLTVNYSGVTITQLPLESPIVLGSNALTFGEAVFFCAYCKGRS